MPNASVSNPAVQILPSLLAADFGRLADACIMAERADADGLHLDVMDGHFVPNISFGPEVVRVARRSCGLPLSVHLMVTRPDIYIDSFIEAGSDLILIQVESSCDVLDTLDAIRRHGRRAGVVLNPETPLDAAGPYADRIDELMCMTVHPGFGGQAFLPGVAQKIKEARGRWPRLDISVDGGINRQTGEICAAAGANVFIAGTSLYRAPDMKSELDEMRAALADGRKR